MSAKARIQWVRHPKEVDECAEGLYVNAQDVVNMLDAHSGKYATELLSKLIDETNRCPTAKCHPDL